MPLANLLPFLDDFCSQRRCFLSPRFAEAQVDDDDNFRIFPFLWLFICKGNAAEPDMVLNFGDQFQNRCSV